MLLPELLPFICRPTRSSSTRSASRRARSRRRTNWTRPREVRVRPAADRGAAADCRRAACCADCRAIVGERCRDAADVALQRAASSAASGSRSLASVADWIELGCDLHPKRRRSVVVSSHRPTGHRSTTACRSRTSIRPVRRTDFGRRVTQTGDVRRSRKSARTRRRVDRHAGRSSADVPSFQRMQLADQPICAPIDRPQCTTRAPADLLRVLDCSCHGAEFAVAAASSQ